MKAFSFIRRGRIWLLAGLLGWSLAGAFAAPQTNAPVVVPLPNTHAHNDYEHVHPLFDALAQGFCSVEADIHLVGGELLVAHDAKHLDPQRTLESLYLAPLRKRIRENGGRVYRGGPQCVLLIDFKTDGAAMYPVLRRALEAYADIFSVFNDGRQETNALLAVLTGGYPRELLAADPVRYAAGDGKVGDLDTNPPAALVPWISENWAGLFRWRGAGVMPATDAAKLDTLVRLAHEQGRRVRFWGAPDQAVFWQALQEHQVDLINSDDLAGVAKFMAAHR